MESWRQWQREYNFSILDADESARSQVYEIPGAQKKGAT